MTALLFCIALFGYWAAIGYALLAWLSPPIGHRLRAMLSPALGAALVVMPIFALNHFGLAVETFATAVLALLGIAAAVVLAWKRPRFPWRQAWPFVAILVAALLLAGWPMTLYGFEWISYANSDMTHYGLGTMRVLHGGYFDLPDESAILNGTDYAAFDAYKYLLHDARAGSELMLAALWAATGLNAHYIFMPVTIALHLALVAAAAAMVAGPRFPRRTAILAALLVAISPLTTLGAMYQLIAQVGGLAFFCASVVLLYQAHRVRTWRMRLAASVPAVVSMGGLFIWYPEVIPFLGLGWFVFIIGLALRNARRARNALEHAVTSGVLLLAVLNVYFVGAILFMLGQAQQSGVDTAVLKSSEIAVSAFPYFLIPSGVPIFWGLIPLGLDTSFLLLTASFLFAIALTIWLAPGFWISLRRASPAAAVLLVMVALAAVLFHGRKDFPLFKLAMYAQPFLLAIVSERLASAGPRFRARMLGWGLVGVASLAALGSQFGYVWLSAGEYLGGMCEIWHGSASKVTSSFAGTVATLKEKSPAGYTSDTSSLVHLQQQTFHSRGYSAFYPGGGVYGLEDAAKYTQVGSQLPDTFSLELSGLKTTFSLPKHLKEELARRWLVTIPRYVTIFNQAQARRAPPGYYQISPPQQVRDHLIFMPSNLGEDYYGFYLAPIAYNHLERDPMFAGRAFSGLGRGMLFIAMNPSPRPRILMELTSTVMGQFDRRLPQPTVHGATRQPVAFVGRGSGRVVSEPIEPEYVQGVAFVALDMGRVPRLTPHDPVGVMALYGKEINPDLRRLTAYGREISLISEEEYAALSPPSELREFPRDLGNPELEYSGMYEDGWISEESFFVLGAKPGADRFRIAGMIPLIADAGFTATISVRVDGAPAITRSLKLGDFSLDVPLKDAKARKHRIEVRFDRSQVLPGVDGRVTGGLITYAGLVAGP